jgi:hypothetical protein
MRFVELPDDVHVSAWLHFCHGHHIEFLYWQVTTEACERVVAGERRGDERAVAHWTDRLCALIEGSAAMLHYCADLVPDIYDPCLRASMEAERDDFSGDMSRDFLSMMAAKAELIDVLEASGHHDEDLKRFRLAERYWTRHHGQVVMELHPGQSLLREKMVALQAESDAFDYRHYVDTVVHGDESMTIDEYWTQAVHKIDVVHHDFAMDAETRTHLMRGDGALLATLSESLAGDPPA